MQYDNRCLRSSKQIFLLLDWTLRKIDTRYAVYFLLFIYKHLYFEKHKILLLPYKGNRLSEMRSYNV